MGRYTSIIICAPLLLKRGAAHLQQKTGSYSRMRWRVLDLSGTEQGQVSGCREDGDEPSGYITKKKKSLRTYATWPLIDSNEYDLFAQVLKLVDRKEHDCPIYDKFDIV